jgi:hypothetical protein
MVYQRQRIYLNYTGIVNESVNIPNSRVGLFKGFIMPGRGA